jgi:hypothetical protein
MFAGLLLGNVSFAKSKEKLIDSFAAKKVQIVKIIDGGTKIIALNAIPLSACSAYK